MVKIWPTHAYPLAIALHADKNIFKSVKLYSKCLLSMLRGQATVFHFSKSKTCTCNREVEINSNEDIRDAIVYGLTDEDICLDILGQCCQDIIHLDETLQMVEAKECGKDQPVYGTTLQPIFSQINFLNFSFVIFEKIKL